MDDSSDFASSDFDKSKWDALKRCFQSDGVDFHDSISVDNNSQVSKVPTDRDILASMRGAAVMDKRNLLRTEMQKTC
jgi:hypothetical protein